MHLVKHGQDFVFDIITFIKLWMKLSSRFISYIQTLLLNELTKHANIASDHTCLQSFSIFWSACRYVCKAVEISVWNLLLPCRSMEKPQSVNFVGSVCSTFHALALFDNCVLCNFRSFQQASGTSGQIHCFPWGRLTLFIFMYCKQLGWCTRCELTLLTLLSLFVLSTLIIPL